MNSETVEALHALTSQLKDEHERMQRWLEMIDADPHEPGEGYGLEVSRAEGERIFADRIAAHEARLKEQGWTRTVRVESQPAGGTGVDQGQPRT